VRRLSHGFVELIVGKLERPLVRLTAFVICINQLIQGRAFLVRQMLIGVCWQPFGVYILHGFIQF